MGLLLAAVLLLDTVTYGAANWLLLAAPIHLFAHLRGVYATSVTGALIRMVLLFVGSVVGFTALMIGLLGVGLSATGG